jgi:hypothetical protein
VQQQDNKMPSLGVLAKLTQAANAERVAEQNFRSSLFAQGRQEIIQSREMRLREREAIKNRNERNKDRDIRERERKEDLKLEREKIASREKIAGISGGRAGQLSVTGEINALADIGRLEAQILADEATNETNAAVMAEAKKDGITLAPRPVIDTSSRRQILTSMKSALAAAQASGQTRSGAGITLPNTGQLERSGQAEGLPATEVNHLRASERPVRDAQGRVDLNDPSRQPARLIQGGGGATEPLRATPVENLRPDPDVDPNSQPSVAAKVEAPEEDLNPDQPDSAADSVARNVTRPAKETPTLIRNPENEADVAHNNTVILRMSEIARNAMVKAAETDDDELRRARTIRATNMAKQVAEMKTFNKVPKGIDKADEGARSMMAAYITYLLADPAKEKNSTRGKNGDWIDTEDKVIPIIWNEGKNTATPREVRDMIVAGNLEDSFTELLNRNNISIARPRAAGATGENEPKNAADARQQGLLFQNEKHLRDFRKGEAIKREAGSRVVRKK